MNIVFLAHACYFAPVKRKPQDTKIDPNCDTPLNHKKAMQIKSQDEENKSKTPTHTLRWPKPDEIKWLQNRLAEQETPKMYQKVVVPEAEDIKVWLAREKDKRSWAEIAREIYNAKSAAVIDAAKSKARRAYQQVERYWTDGKIHPTGTQAWFIRRQKTWEEENFTPGYWNQRSYFLPR